MKFPYCWLLVFLPLAHSIPSTNSESLPTVDLGYEIHQALYYDVSKISPQSTFTNIPISLSISCITSATFATPKLPLALSAGRLPGSLSITDLQSKSAMLERSALRHTRHGIFEASSISPGIPMLIRSHRLSSFLLLIHEKQKTACSWMFLFLRLFLTIETARMVLLPSWSGCMAVDSHFHTKGMMEIRQRSSKRVSKAKTPMV